jgi:hypothetical protein
MRWKGAKRGVEKNDAGHSGARRAHQLESLERTLSSSWPLLSIHGLIFWKGREMPENPEPTVAGHGMDLPSAECCPLAMRLDSGGWTLDESSHGRSGQRGNNQLRPDVSPHLESWRRALHRAGIATSPTPLIGWPKLIPYPLSGFQAAGWPPQTLLGCHSPKPTKNCQKSTCGRRIPPHPKKVRRTPREGTQPNLSTPKPQFAPSKPQPWLFPALRCKFEPQQLSQCSGDDRWNRRAGGSIPVARQHHRRGRQQQFGRSRTNADEPLPPAPSAESSSPTVSSMPS